MEPATPVVLEYSVPSEGERRWGPLFFRPSRATVLLFLLTCATVAWLALRHQPWRLVTTVPCDYVDSPYRRVQLYATFTPDGLLLFDSTHGARLYDPATGSLLRTVLPTLDRNRYHYYAFTRSRHILAFPNAQGRSSTGPATLFGFEGKQIAQFPNLGRNGNEVVISPVSPTVLYRDRLHARLPLIVHDLTGASEEVRLYRRELAHGDLRLEDTRFSPDGSRVIVSHWGIPDFNTRYVEVFDLRTGKRIGQPVRCIVEHEARADHGFAGSDEIWFDARGESDRKRTVEFHALDSGRIRRVMVSSPNMIVDQAISSDGALVAHSASGARVTAEIRDTHTGNIIAVRPTSTITVRFFPESNRFLTGHASARQLVIGDPYHDQPLAVLPAESTFTFWPPSVISPDGQTIVASIDPARRKVAIYRKTGWDCPESHLGALAFLHVWLLCLAFTGAVICAARDARRARIASPIPPPDFIAYMLIAIALALSLQFVLVAALGRWSINPGPILLLAGIGLVTHARFWRLLALVLLSVSIGWSIYLLNALREAGLKESSLYALLDRAYSVPHLLPALALTLAILFCGAGLYFLARRRPVETFAAA